MEIIGKCSPVHFWWGGLTSHAHASPAVAHQPPRRSSKLPDYVMVEAYSHEAQRGLVAVRAGIGFTAFYAYAYQSLRILQSGGRLQAHSIIRIG